jgi:hypothetical protein
MSAEVKIADRKTLLEFLDDRYYGELSAAAHLKGSGLTMSVTPFVMDGDEGRPQNIEVLRAKFLISTAMLLTAMLSELEMEFRIGLASDSRKIWDLLPTWRPWEARELYDQYYRSRLSAL